MFLCERVSFKRFAECMQASSASEGYSERGLQAIFEHLNKSANEVGQPLELDPLDVMLMYFEFSSVQELLDTYNISKRDASFSELLQLLPENVEVIFCAIDNMGYGSTVVIEYQKEVVE